VALIGIVAIYCSNIFLSYLRLCSHLQVVTWNNVPGAQGRSSSCPHGVVFRKYVLPNGDTRKSHAATIKQVRCDKGYLTAFYVSTRNWVEINTKS